MVNNITISAILPCWNEEGRVVPVLKAIQSCQFLDEIIVVDDGSNQKTKEVLSKNLNSNIKLITHSKNLGKTKALLSGVAQSNGDLILFVDTDVVNLKPHHLLKLIEPVAQGRYDMSLADLQFEPFYNKLIGYSIAYTGERVLRHQILKDHPEIFKAKGYNIEASINRYFFHHARVVNVKFEKVGQFSKEEKIGLKGLKDDNKMIQNQIKFLGWNEFLYQILTSLNLPDYP